MIRNDVAITPELVKEHGLKPDEYERFVNLIGREPTITELGIVSAMWNEHCSYKSSRIHLRGVPTIGGSVGFDKRYNGNILVNAMAVGLARTDEIWYAKATGVGNPIVYLGSKTGRDGIHGATMASAEFDDASDEKRPTVQVGDPFAEKLLLEACLELMASGAVIAIQDMGAAGLTCSAVEMGAKGDLGVELWLEKVPTLEEGMTPYEMMLSESQERMLMVLKPRKKKEAEAIFAKWGLDFAVIGKTTDTLRFVVKHLGEVMADLPIKELGDEAPIYTARTCRTSSSPRSRPKASG